MRKMKNSGIEWIGEIPAKWNIVRIGTQYNERKIRVSDTEYPPLSVTMRGIVPQLATAAKTDAHDDRKLVCKGDFAINSRSDRRGSCGISAYDGSVSLINTILCPRDKMNPQYYDWLFHSTMFSDEFYKWGHGIVNDLWTTNWQDMKKIYIPEPPLVEQEQIASFLDQKCAEIDAVIEKTKATIEEYKKLKQSVITEAVTKGIRDNRPMKDSDIEWIGDIPADWGITTIGRMCFVTKLAGFEFTKDMVTNITNEGEVPIVRAQNIKMGRFLNTISEFISLSLSQKLNRCALDKKCLIITFIGAGIGEVAIFNEEKRFHLAPNVAKIVINDEMKKFISEEYLLYFLMSNAGQEEINKIKKATAQPSLSMETIRSMKCLVPNTLQEQLAIIEVLDQKCTEINNLIAKKTNLLTELETYKKSLIYEYVTGKKEVEEVSDNTTVAVVYPYFPAVLNTDKARFAQAVLMSKILDSNVKYMGRVKLEKMLFTIEHCLGFDFDTDYVRQKAGPLDGSIYECEKIVSRTNKWFYVNNSRYGTSYKPQKNIEKYKTYYKKYFSDYNEEIESIIGVFENYSLEQSEIVATLFAAWNDAIIDNKPFTDEDVVNDVLNNWHESKRRFAKDVWLRAMDEMRRKNLIPKGYGKKTVIKNDTM